RDRRVVAEVPPEVVRKLLGAAVDLPAALDRERVVVDHEDAARSVAVGVAERAHVDPIRTAVDGVGSAVAGTVGDLFRFDRMDELGLLGSGSDVEDVDARRTQPGNEQVAPLHVWMRGVGAKRGTAYVPSEVMELVADVGCVDASDLPAEALGFRIDVERYQPVRRPPCRVERDDVGERLDWRFRRDTRRRLTGLIGSEEYVAHAVR